jgi:hypothetical protein
MRSWTDIPPDLVTILRRTQELKKAGMIYMCFLQTGEVQVSVQKGQDAKVHGAVDKDPLMALLRALGPPEGGSWAEHLDLKPAPKKASVPRVKRAPPPPGDDDDMDCV